MANLYPTKADPVRRSDGINNVLHVAAAPIDYECRPFWKEANDRDADADLPSYLPNEVEIARITFKDASPVSIRTSFHFDLYFERAVIAPDIVFILRSASPIPLSLGELLFGIWYCKHGPREYLRQRFSDKNLYPTTLRDITDSIKVDSRWYPSLSRCFDLHITDQYNASVREGR